MLQRRPMAQAIALLFSGLVFQPAHAQQSETTTERVEITGSRIKRVDAETASAVQVISKEEIARSGAITLTDVLRNVPAGNTGGYNTEGPPTQSFGAAGISLRGLGVGSTLVLVNGRRTAPYGFGTASFVDTNSIPVDAIERIETLLDGASAIYGADAIAGVINIILRKDYQGKEISGSLGTSGYRDANARSAGFSWGQGSLAKDGYNWMINYGHHEQDPVLANARPRTKDADFRRFNMGDSRSSFYRNVYQTGGYYGGDFIAPLSGCTPLNDPATPALNGRCVLDNTKNVNVVSASTNDSIYATTTYELGSGWQAFGDASFSRVKYAANTFSYGTSAYAAYTYDLVDVKGEFGNAPGSPIAYLVLPVGHPQNPLKDKPAAVRYNFDDIQNRIHSANDNLRLTLGLRGNLGAWDTEVGVMYAKAKGEIRYRGYLQDAILTGEVLDKKGYVNKNFVLGNAAANDAGLMSRLYPSMSNLSDTSTALIDVKASRELWQLAGGRVGVALGGEFRQEKFSSIPDNLFSSGAIQLFTITGSEGKRNVAAVYGEIVAPVLKNLEFNAAVRVDRYNDFGTATTPKFGVKWKVLPQWALRSTYAHGFRAPTLPEMNSGTIAGYMKVQDPKFCPVFTADNAQCDRYVQYEIGQNPNLKAEKSKSFTLGTVIEPANGWSMALDYYAIQRRDEVSQLSAKYLLDHESAYPNLVIRHAGTNVIDKLLLLTSNLAQTEVRGIDLDARGELPLAEYGKLRLNASLNRVLSFKTGENPSAEKTDLAGYYITPKNRARFGLGWEKGDLNAGLSWNYVAGYQLKATPESNCTYQEKNPSYCQISSWLTSDAYLTYRYKKNLNLSLTVQNLTNKEAPFDASMIGYLQGFNASFHNQLGRYVQVSAKYSF